jgi:hypothetical protein
VDTTTLEVLLDGADITAGCTAGATTASCSVPSPLGIGMHTITARVNDNSGNIATATFSFEILPPGAAVTILSPAADTFLRRGAKNRNQGEESYLRIKASGWNRALIRFDAAEIAALRPGPVPRAILELFIEKNRNNWGAAGRTVDVHRVTAEWTELGATWNCAGDSNTANQQPDCASQWNGGTFDPSPIDTVLHTKGLSGWIQFDVTAEVNAILAGSAHHGWIVKKTDERKAGFVLYTSREGAAGQHPRLVIGVEGPTPAPSVTPTDTFTQTPSLTPTLAPTPTEGGEPTPTFTPLPTDTHTALPTHTATDTPTRTPTPSGTPTPTASETSTPTATATETPVPPGVIAGEVYDDATAQPLAHVSVVVSVAVENPGPGTQNPGPVTTDSSGRYALGGLNIGTYTLSFSKDGYTRGVRQMTVESGRAVRVRDVRLTPLRAAAVIGSEGGTLAAEAHVPGSAGAPGVDAAVELEISAGMVSDPTEMRLTVLGPQGPIAPLPLGWSVLLGAAIDPPLPAEHSGPAALRVPAELLAAGVSLPVAIAVWDDATSLWLGGPDAAHQSGAIEIELSDFATPISQVALLVADAEPEAPPPAVTGEALEGVLAGSSAGQSATVIADPPVIIAGTNGRAYVLATLRSLDPLPSGTLIEASLEESYDFIAGGRLLGLENRQDLAGYQISPMADGVSPLAGALGAYFRLQPSRQFVFGELSAGRVKIDVGLPGADESEEVIDTPGGDVSGPGGIRITVPPDAAGGPAVIRVNPVLPESLPAGTGGDPSFLGALRLDVSGAGLDPFAAYAIDLGVPLAAGQRVLIGRIGPTDLGTGLILTAFGYEENGRIIADACPAGLSFCLGGFGANGTYAIFALPAGAAIVTGTVTNASVPRSGIAVRSDTSPAASITDNTGRYALPAPLGVASTLSASDRVQDLHGSATVTPAMADEVIVADIELLPTAPRVVQIDPPNHAGNVPPDAVITVTFSEAIAAASVQAPAAVTLRRDCPLPTADCPLTAAVAVRRSLSSDGNQLTITPSSALAPESVYVLTLTDAITDHTGVPLAANSPTANRFTSDFTTAAVFTAASLPPNTLRVSLPHDEDGNVVAVGEVGRTFVCAGAQLALPGTLVTVTNDATGVTETVTATGASGASGSEVCDALFPGRCNTSAPGRFCAVLDAGVGDKILVQVEDVFGNLVTLDAGNMRDERTGATAVGPEGARVTAVDDPRYVAEVPPGAFDTVRTVTVVPVANENFPVELPPDAGLTRAGGVFLDLGDDEVVSAREIDLTIPAPDGFDLEAQILVGHVINFRGIDELTLVDTASVEIDELGQMLLSTDSPPFEGVRRSGYYDMSTPDRGVGYVIGVVDKEHSTGDIIASPLFYVFPFLEVALTKFVMPVLADEPAVVSLVGLDGTVRDSVSIVGPPLGQFLQIPGLTDSDTPAGVSSISIPGDEMDVPSDDKIILELSRPVSANPDGSLPAGAIVVTDQSGQVIDGLWVVVSADFKRVQFFPTRPLPPGAQITVTVGQLFDVTGDPFAAFASTFSTFKPELRASVPMRSNDVDILRHVESDGIRPYAVVARDGDETNDSLGGIVAVDIADPFAPRIAGELLTHGIDRAVRVVTHDPARVVSVDGAGHPQRYGTLRALDFSNPAQPFVLGHRTLNLSPQAISGQIFLGGVPAEGGVPRSVALLGTDAVYVANPPIIGVQQATLSRFIPTHNGIEGIYTGSYRAVETVGNYVIAAGQRLGQNEVVVLTPALVPVSRYPLNASPLEIIAVPRYPVDIDGDGNLGDAEDLDGDATTQEEETFDFVVVQCQSHALCVLQVQPSGTLSLASTIALPSGMGSPRGGAVDPQLRVLYLAAGTAGLAAINFHDPFNAAPGNPVLATVELPGQARRVKLHSYAGGSKFAFVASSDGLHIVEVAPPSVRFVSAREEANEVNAIINRVAKYDPYTDAQTGEQRFGAPINRLYMVARAQDGQFRLLLDLSSATVPRDQVLWGIYDSTGNKVRDGRMPLVGPAAVEFAPGGSGETALVPDRRVSVQESAQSPEPPSESGGRNRSRRSVRASAPAARRDRDGSGGSDRERRVERPHR